MWGWQHHGCGPQQCGPRRGRTFVFGVPGGWGGFGGEWGAGGPGPGRGRMFGHGDLKFVILNLLAEKPRHGYEIIKELEERFGGTYSPSPGTVYPTLSLLEDLGYARSQVEEGNRKVFEITDEGRKYLEENRSTIDDIFGRVDDFGSFIGPVMAGLGRAYANLGRAALRTAARHQADEEWIRKAREILERAARDIEGLN